jgi:hypothetical protein
MGRSATKYYSYIIVLSGLQPTEAGKLKILNRIRNSHKKIALTFLAPEFYI